MKRIFINGILYIVISWTVFYLLSFIWEGESYNFCLGFFCILGPIGYIYSLINGYIKSQRFKKLEIDYNASIPCYVFLGLFEIRQDKFKEVKKASSLTYAICLCSKNNLYFYKCDKSLMTLEKLDYEMCDDINGAIISLTKNEVLKFRYTDLGRSSADKMGDWITNKIVGHLQSFFTNRVRTKVSMDATVEVYFKQNDAIKVLVFGIPESLVSSFSIDFYSFLPEIVDTAHGYLSECEEVLSFYDDDPIHVKKAKKIIRGIFYQSIN